MRFGKDLVAAGARAPSVMQMTCINDVVLLTILLPLMPQVCVPQHMATTLTYPERVTEYNIMKLKSRILNGNSTWPGANFVVASDGARISLMNEKIRRKAATELKVGWQGPELCWWGVQVLSASCRWLHMLCSALLPHGWSGCHPMI